MIGDDPQHGATDVAEAVPGDAAAARSPVRLTLLTCVGCGAATRPGSCPDGCWQERRQDIVPAVDYDAVQDRAAMMSLEIAAFASVVEQLAAAPVQPADAARALAEIRIDAREATHRVGVGPGPSLQGVEVTEAWECVQCGGIDAPAPCIGVCIRQPAQWVTREAWGLAAKRSDRLQQRADAARALVLAVAHTTPRTGRELDTWDALRRRAVALAAAPGE